MGDAVVCGRRPVHGRRFPRAQGKETLPHRQCRVGTLRDHHEIRRRTRSRTVDFDGSVPTSRTSNGRQTQTGATRRAQSASSPQELLTISAQAMNPNPKEFPFQNQSKKKRNKKKINPIKSFLFPPAPLHFSQFF